MSGSGDRPPPTDHARVGLDADGRVVALSAAASELLGVTPEDAVGRPLPLRLGDADGEPATVTADLLRDASEAGRVEHAGWLRHGDGRRSWLEVEVTALRGGDGRLGGFEVALSDLTEQRVLELRLHESEDRYRRLVSQVRDYAIIGLDPDGLVSSWNAGAEELKGYAPEEAIGRHFSMFYTEEDRAAGLPGRLLDEAAEVGRVEDAGWRVRQDGSRFWADVVITALRDEDGALSGFAKVTRDVTEQHRLEVALRENEARFRLLVLQVKDYAIVALDEDGVVSSWNVGAEMLQGYSADEAVGRHFSMFYTPEDRAARLPAQLLERARVEGSVRHAGWRVRKDGSRFWGDVVITALHDDAGRVTGYAKVTRDLTEQHRLEEARASFIAGVSHQFRTPLTSIVGFAEMLGATDDPDRRLDYVERITANAERLRLMVEQLLERTALQTRGVPVRAVPIDAASFLEDVVDRLEGLLHRTPVSIAADDVRVLADPELLTRVLRNLLSNATTFAAPGSPVDLRARRGAPGRVVIEVRDRGRGIDEDDLGAVFDDFQRGRRARTEDGQGLGIGLTLVRQLVREQGGTVSLEPAVGGGTRVVIDLPEAPP